LTLVGMQGNMYTS